MGDRLPRPPSRTVRARGRAGARLRARWAALFDWDGVIVDSSRAHEKSWGLLARDEGRTLPDGHFRRGFGMKNEEIIPDLLGWTRDPREIARLSKRKEELFRAVVRREGISPLPGVRAWLRRLRAAGVPCVIASSTQRKNIETLLAMTGLEGFAGIVSAEDVRKGKPAPDVFLRAAEVAGVAPDRAVVFEDAVVGLQAARAAGMRAIAVTTTNPADRLAGADRVVARLDKLRVSELAAWFR